MLVIMKCLLKRATQWAWQLEGVCVCLWYLNKVKSTGALLNLLLSAAHTSVNWTEQGWRSEGWRMEGVGATCRRVYPCQAWNDNILWPVATSQQNAKEWDWEEGKQRERAVKITAEEDCALPKVEPRRGIVSHVLLTQIKASKEIEKWSHSEERATKTTWTSRGQTQA